MNTASWLPLALGESSRNLRTTLLPTPAQYMLFRFSINLLASDALLAEFKPLWKFDAFCTSSNFPFKWGTEAKELQGSAKRWDLGCVNPASWLPLAVRVSSHNLAFAFPCTSGLGFSSVVNKSQMICDRRFYDSVVNSRVNLCQFW